jgi:hypothetical protein
MHFCRIQTISRLRSAGRHDHAEELGWNRFRKLSESLRSQVCCSHPDADEGADSQSGRDAGSDDTVEDLVAILRQIQER